PELHAATVLRAQTVDRTHHEAAPGVPVVVPAALALAAILRTRRTDEPAEVPGDARPALAVLLGLRAATVQVHDDRLHAGASRSRGLEVIRGGGAAGHRELLHAHVSGFRELELLFFGERFLGRIYRRLGQESVARDGQLRAELEAIRAKHVVRLEDLLDGRPVAPRYAADGV